MPAHPILLRLAPLAALALLLPTAPSALASPVPSGLPPLAVAEADTAAPVALVPGPAVPVPPETLAQLGTNCLLGVTDVTVRHHTSARITASRGDVVVHHLILHSPERPTHGCAALVAVSEPGQMGFEMHGGIAVRDYLGEWPANDKYNRPWREEPGAATILIHHTFAGYHGDTRLHFDYDLSIDESHFVSTPVMDEAASATIRDGIVTEARHVHAEASDAAQATYLMAMADADRVRDAAAAESADQRDRDLAAALLPVNRDRARATSDHAVAVAAIEAEFTRATALARATEDRALRAGERAFRTAVTKANRGRTKSIKRAKRMSGKAERTRAIRKARAARNTKVKRAKKSRAAVRAEIRTARRHADYDAMILRGDALGTAQAARDAKLEPLRVLAEWTLPRQFEREHEDRHRPALSAHYASWETAKSNLDATTRDARALLAFALGTAEREHTERVSGRTWTILPRVLAAGDEVVEVPGWS